MKMMSNDEINEFLADTGIEEGTESARQFRVVCAQAKLANELSDRLAGAGKTLPDRPPPNNFSGAWEQYADSLSERVTDAEADSLRLHREKMEWFDKYHAIAAQLAEVKGDAEKTRRLAILETIQIVGECRVLICETVPVEVCAETAEQLCDQLRALLPPDAALTAQLAAGEEDAQR